MKDLQHHAWAFGVGAATVWHATAEWGVKLGFAVAVSVLSPRVGRLFDLGVATLERLVHKDKK